MTFTFLIICFPRCLVITKQRSKLNAMQKIEMAEVLTKAEILEDLRELVLDIQTVNLLQKCPMVQKLA